MSVTRITNTPNGFVSTDDVDFGNSQPAGAAFPFSPEPRVCGTVVRYNEAPGSALSEPTYTRYHHNPSAGTSGGSVIATLSATYGKPTVELIPGDPSSRTGIETALREGLIRRTAAGHLEDVLTEPGKQAELNTAAPRQEPPTEDPSAGAIDHDDEALWAEDIADMPQHAYDSAAASLVNVVAHGVGSFEDAAKSLAVNAGIDPALALDYVQQGYAMHERIVARAVAPLGITGAKLEAFYECIKNQTAKLQDAVQRVVHSRDVSGFRELAVAFKIANPSDGAVYKAAGFETAVDRSTGDLMLKRPGGNWVRASDLK